MKILPLLLRLMLCVSLIANGVGAAQASMRMQVAHRAHAVASGPAVTTANVQAREDASPCHRHASLVQTRLAHAAQAPAVQPRHDQPDDCCKDSACSCACAHLFCSPPAGLVVAAASPPVVLVAGAVIDRPQPRLPHLIRPPIG